MKTTAKTRQNDERPLTGPSSSRRSTLDGEINGDRLYHLSTAPTRADARERKRSALAGVWIAKKLLDLAHAAHLRARDNYHEAIVTARDEGATVQEIAGQAGVSRNAIYLLNDRVRKGRS